jgi:hypothetical protein
MILWVQWSRDIGMIVVIESEAEVFGLDEAASEPRL